MKYILAAIFLIGTTLSYPLGESDESKPEASIINPNSLSSPKSQESDEAPKHHDHHHDEAHKDVSHEHHKEPQRDSLETSEESLESNEKPEQQAPKIVELAPEEIKPSEEKLLDKPEQEEKKPEGKEVEEPKIADEKSHIEEPIDIVEAVNKPAAIAAESAVPDEQFIKHIEHIPEKKVEEPIPQSDSIPDQPHVEESPIEQGNLVAAEEEGPKDKGKELLSEGKSDLLDIPQAIKEEELKIQKPAEEISAPLPIEADIEKEALISKENETKKLLPELISDKPEEVSHSS